jgi:hypothetical protein
LRSNSTLKIFILFEKIKYQKRGLFFQPDFGGFECGENLYGEF